jgi:CheY-like chemotaxis protein
LQSGYLYAVIVEDNRVNRLIAERLIRQLGHVPEHAENGSVGLKMVSEAAQPYDLILMDCQMPVMDGVRSVPLNITPDCYEITTLTGSFIRPCLQFECARMVRTLPDPTRAGVPIIALSASTQQADLDHSTAAGMDDYLSKPVDLASIKTRIQRWLPAFIESPSGDLKRPGRGPA